MSSIKALELCNVRAFGPRPQKINFGMLTLIVGHNGSGKTTIVESLKYGTTGKVPPGTEKQEFLHDPSLRGESESRALIKVELFDPTGKRVVASRHMKVVLGKDKTKKANALKFQGGDNTLMHEEMGNMLAQATKQTSIDEILPQTLGVNPAVLQTVIFCHQDDSFWPLDTASEVKTRFDALFEADRWSRAVKDLEDQWKKHKAELKNQEKDVDHAQSNKAAAQRSLSKCGQLEREIEAENEKSAELSTRMNEIGQKRQAASEQMQRAYEIVGKLEGKRMQAVTSRQRMEMLEGRLEELEESDQELEHRLVHYNERLKADEDTLVEQEQEKATIQQKLKDSRNLLVDKQSEHQSLQQQHENHLRAVDDRVAFVKEAANAHDVRGYALDLSTEQIDEFLLRLTKMARDSNTALDRARIEARKEIQTAQLKLKDISDRKTGVIIKKDSIKQQTILDGRKMDAWQHELDGMNVNEGDQAALQHQLEAYNVQLASLEQASQAANWSARLSSMEAELREIEQEKNKLELEQDRANQAAGDTAQLDNERKKIEDRQLKIRSLLAAHQNQLNAVLGQDWSASSVDSAYKNANNQATSELADARKRRDGFNAELTQAHFTLTKCRDAMRKAQSEVDLAAKAIDDVTIGGPSSYLQELQNAQETRDTAQNDVGGFKILLDYFDKCIEDATQRKACRVCSRALPKDTDIHRLEQSIARQRATLSLSDAGADLAAVEQELQTLQAVQKHFNDWTRLTTQDLPNLRTQETSYVSQVQNLTNKLEEQDAVVNVHATALRDVEAISKTVTSLDRYHSDMTESENEVRSLTAKLQASGTSRGLEAIKHDRNDVTQLEVKLRADMSQTRAEKDNANAQVTSLKLTIKDHERLLNDNSHQLKHKLGISKQMADLKAATAEQRQALITLEKDAKSLDSELAEAQQVYDATEERVDERERALQAQAKKLADSLQRLKQSTNDIEAYVNTDGEGQLKRARLAMTQLKRDISELDVQATTLDAQSSILQNTLRNHEQIRRNIDDNLQYRKHSQELQRVSEDIRDLESRDAETEYSRHKADADKLQRENEQLIAERSSVIASAAALDKQLTSEQDDFDNYHKDAAEKYRIAKINVAVTHAIVKDLDKYCKALDLAIMNYHKHQMEEINRVIDELWRKTYQGTDVDTISIRTDGIPKSSSAKYNYRVCMVKQQTELNMRGRCSAGQRVLACLIIRLALAECFGGKCGMIALDEPTTNLDRDNIQALATSLAELINARRAQKNFQLIVITHDEDFLKCMQPSDYVDDFYRVDRDINQESFIKRESIHTLMR